jgi:hypothetical protein
MRLRIYPLALFCMLVTSIGFGQDLSQLQTRVSKLWEARSRLSRAEALKYIEPETQDLYLQQTETPISSFKISSIEFTDDPNRVRVSVTVHGVTAGLAEMDRLVRDTWVWKDGQWLMQAASVSSMFDSDPVQKAAVPVPVDFRLGQTVIDIGKRNQGEVAEGTLPFHGSRVDIRTIRPLQPITGLAFGAPVWRSASEGDLPYRWETTLLSEGLNQTITLEALTTSENRGTADIQVRARIDGRVSFKQIPELVDPMKAPGQVELQVKNVSNKPLKILGVTISNPPYVIDENVPEVIEPGKTGTLFVRYDKATPAGASLNFVFSENLAGMPITTVPLHTQIRQEKRASTYTIDDFKQFAPKETPAVTLPPAK